MLIAQPHFAQRNFGALAAAGAGLLSAISLLAINRIRHIHTTAIVAHGSAVAVLTSSIAVGASVQQIDAAFVHSPKAILLLIAVATMGTTAQLGLTRAFSSASWARLAPLQYLAVAFGAFADFLFFAHVPAPMTVVGIALIVGPLIWILTRQPDAVPVRHVEVGELPDLTDAEIITRLEVAVKRAERLSSCEVRVHLDRVCADRLARPREVFRTIGMEKTRLRNGILVYLAIDSGVFAVVVDEGIGDVVPSNLLDAACARISAAMKGGAVANVVADGIVEVFGLLGRYFPYQQDDTNELEDAVSIGW